MINTILGGRYEILEEIGKGGMAYVYKARCILLNRIVAVKVLRDDLDGGQEFLVRFNTEAQSAASLSHPNIVSIFDVGEDQGRHYIVMECVDGITLKEYITKKGRLDYKEALDIGYQIADALEAAHEKNIVHRDIKPHNILVTPERNIKVADFGIARFGTGNTISADDDILGSVHYISPEQAKGQRVDNRSDLYSLGISLYEMISGKVPFDADTPVAVAMKQIKENAKPIVIEGETVPEGVQQIILKSIRKDVDKRYQSASEFKNDILNLIENPDYVFENEDYNDFDLLSDDNEYNKKPVKQITKKTRNILVISGALTALLCVTIGVLATTGSFLNTVKSVFSFDSLKAPNLIGKHLDEATKICNEIGLKIVVEETNDSQYEPGIVVSQIPEESKTISEGSEIKLKVNKDVLSAVPDYTGKSYKVAQTELKKAGYKVDLVYEESKKSEDCVLRQSPPGNSQLKKGTTITLYVSAGISVGDDYKTVPTLLNTSYSECLNLLEENELSVGEIDSVETPHDDDVVISQAIPQGSLVKKGSAVGITLRCDHEEEKDENSAEDSGDEDNGN